MDDVERRLGRRLRALAEAVPVRDPIVRTTRATSTPRTAGVLPMLTGLVVLVVAVVLGTSLVAREATPASTAVPSGGSPPPAGTPLPSTVPSATPKAAATTAPGGWLRLSTLLEACPHGEGGQCYTTATLTGPDGASREVYASSGPLAVPVGQHQLVVQMWLPGDVGYNGSPPPASLLASCTASFGPTRGETIDVHAVVRSDSCVLQVDDGRVASEPVPTRPPADVSLPYPEGCAAYELSPRRCAYIVAQAIREAGATNTPARIELLGDPACEGEPSGCNPARLGSFFVVQVRVTPEGRAPSDHPVLCGLGGWGSLRCADEPQVRVTSPMLGGYEDVPCGPQGDPEDCASPVPAIDPNRADDGLALRVARVDIPIDHTGAYVIDIGDAVLPNGQLTKASMTLADDTRTDVLIPDGIALQVIGEDGEPLWNRYDHGWRKGVERVHVVVRFEVEMFDPGTSITLTDIVVR